MTAWAGHEPSAFDWQVLILDRRGGEHLVQYPAAYALATVRYKASLTGAELGAAAYAIRNSHGMIVSLEALCNALHEPRHPLDAEAAIARFVATHMSEVVA